MTETAADARILADKLLDWIETNNKDDYSITRWEKDNSIGLDMKTEFAAAQIDVVFLEAAVVEYRIINSKEENVFYLHFELNDLDHAKELFHEMRDCLDKQTSSETRHILLCCSCGLTTSFFTMKLNEAAETLGVDMEFTAVPYEKLFDEAGTKDAVLLAPQIGYRLKTVQEVLTDKVVIQIPVKIFSTYDGAGMITMLNTLFEEKNTEKTEQGGPAAALKGRRKGSVLIVSVIRMESRSQIAYRVYDNGEITAENQITKETYSFSDVQDVIRVAVCTHPELKTICLVTPGMINKGVLTYEDAGITDLNVREILKESYDMSVRLYNDADMIALGYSAIELEGGDTAFYFVPTGSSVGNIGLVINGNTVRGKRHMGGRQMDAVTSLTTFPQNPYTLVKTPEGNIELAARYMTGLYSYTGIRRIAYYSKMIPDAEALREKVAQFIPEAYMPEIVKTESIREYLYAGVLKALKLLNED